MDKRADRGATDDYEALQIVLTENATLRQRVMHRLRALRSMSKDRQDKNVKSSIEEKERKKEPKRGS